MVLPNVDLPQPLSPTSPKVSPGCTVKSGCVPPFTHTVVQPFAGLSLETLQCRERGTSLPDRSECSAAELSQSGSRRDFSPAFAAAASLTPSWTRADACPCPFSADTERLAPSDRQRR